MGNDKNCHLLLEFLHQFLYMRSCYRVECRCRLVHKQHFGLHSQCTGNTQTNEKVVINGNPSLIGSIFRNLTENAIAYSEGKNIYISLLENNDNVCRIRFEDDGKGVLQEQLPHLFERFYRVDKGRSRQKGGTGLGLAIVKHAVQFHGGRISVTNRPNGGLRFDFTLSKQDIQ